MQEIFSSQACSRLLSFKGGLYGHFLFHSPAMSFSDTS